MVTDWNQNALQTAVDYLDYSSFSYPGLYDQLVYEGYTAEQAQYAVDNHIVVFLSDGGAQFKISRQDSVVYIQRGL